MGINRTINFSDEEFRYSDDIIEEVGLGEKYDKTFAKIQDIFGKISKSLILQNKKHLKRHDTADYE